MRVLTLAGALIALPLVSLPASAQNDWKDQAERLVNPNGNRNAYERGRQDQANQEQYNRDERRAARQEQRRRDDQYSGAYRNQPGYRDPY